MASMKTAAHAVPLSGERVAELVTRVADLATRLKEQAALERKTYSDKSISRETRAKADGAQAAWSIISQVIRDAAGEVPQQVDHDLFTLLQAAFSDGDVETIVRLLDERRRARAEEHAKHIQSYRVESEEITNEPL